jgi:hypothetical protein
MLRSRRSGIGGLGEQLVQQACDKQRRIAGRAPERAENFHARRCCDREGEGTGEGAGQGHGHALASSWSLCTAFAPLCTAPHSAVAYPISSLAHSRARRNAGRAGVWLRSPDADGAEAARIARSSLVCQQHMAAWRESRDAGRAPRRCQRANQQDRDAIGPSRARVVRGIFLLAPHRLEPGAEWRRCGVFPAVAGPGRHAFIWVEAGRGRRRQSTDDACRPAARLLRRRGGGGEGLLRNRRHRYGASRVASVPEAGQRTAARLSTPTRLHCRAAVAEQRTRTSIKTSIETSIKLELALEPKLEH